MFVHITWTDDNVDAKQILNFTTTCRVEEISGAISNYVDENGSKWPLLSQTRMDWSSHPGSEPTTLEAVGYWWRYVLVEVHIKDDASCFW